MKGNASANATGTRSEGRINPGQPENRRAAEQPRTAPP